MTADLDEVEVALPELGFTVQHWTSYEISQHFLTPTDGWRLTLGEPAGPDASKLIKLLRGGEKTQFRINGHVQMTGYLDEVITGIDRDGGMQLVLEGRDVLAPVVDGCADPRREFQQEHTLEHVVKTVLGDFGFTADQIVTDNAANRSLQAGAKRGDPVSKRKFKPLKSYRAFRGKPHVGEGAFEFLARVVERYGFYLWPTADGSQVVVGAPNFDQAPSYQVKLKRSLPDQNQTNVLRAGCRRDWSAQPSVIVATGRGDGNVYNRSNNTWFIVNELVAFDTITGALEPQVLAAIKRLPQPTWSNQAFKRTEITNTSHLMRCPRARVTYLHDNESSSIDQLRFFLRRELAHRQKKAFSYMVEVEGHAQDGVPWAVDQMVAVDDDYNEVHENLWILSRTFAKTREGGTRTHLEMIRPGTLEFEAPDDEGTASSTEPGTAAEAVGKSGSSSARSVVNMRKHL